MRAIVVGSIKEDYLKKGIEEYLKRLKAHTQFAIIEVKEVNYKTPRENLAIEAQGIMAKIRPNDYIITLDIAGQLYTSLELAQEIDRLRTLGKSRITFIIGGSNGLAESIKKRSDMALSFSLLTFPHQLMRLIFLEQLYRMFTILNNQEYHK